MTLRIGLFTESYAPIINGVSTSVKTLADELRSADHRPVVIAPRFPGYPDRMTGGPEDIPVLRLPSWTTPLNPKNPFAYPPMGITPRVLRDERFDIVHTQQPFGMGRHGRKRAVDLGVPLISTFHTLYTEYIHYFPFVPGFVTRHFLHIQLRRYYASCETVVVPSRSAGCVLEAIGVRSACIEIVPTGIPVAAPVLPEQVQRERERFRIPPTAPILLFVGRLAREKNVDLLLEAFAELCRTDFKTHSPEAHPVLLLVGSGPNADDCQAHASRLEIQPWVRFAGALPRADLAPIYSLGTLFVFSSSTETQGMVLSEAQSYGLPCVCVSGGGASEFVRDGQDALVVPPASDAFAEALRTLLHNPELRRSYADAALRSPLRPTPAQMAQHLLHIYEAALQTRRLRKNR